MSQLALLANSGDTNMADSGGYGSGSGNRTKEGVKTGTNQDSKGKLGDRYQQEQDPSIGSGEGSGLTAHSGTASPAPPGQQDPRVRRQFQAHVLRNPASSFTKDPGPRSF